MRDTTLDVALLAPSRDEPPISTSVERTVAGRYRLEERLGKGGFGTVWRSHDTVTGADVAVKLLQFRDAGDVRRFRDEAALLRLLELPGVVRLLDDGVDDGTPFLVTEIVNGTPFPRAPSRDAAGWDAIARPTFALLEALSRVHHVGVIHRDLKPANVLVSPSGVPTILDFGVSWGPGFSDSEKGAGVAGTPAYLAPEQALGRAGDDRTDLYTLGVMLFESLSGRMPHRAKDASALLSAKVNQAPRSLREIAPYVPVQVATVVDHMLNLVPNARPGSAATVLELLGGARSNRALPRLGDPTFVERVGKRMLRGESVRAFGQSGSGRSRLLQDVAEWLHARGSEVFAVTALTQVDEVRVAIDRQRDQRTLCLTVEDGAELDPQVLGLLNSGTPSGAVLRLVEVAAEAHVTIPPLAESDLRPLFHGPDRVLHLVEDGARELRRRTDGTPRDTLHVLGSWERAGLCHWDGDKVRVEREALDRLSAGLKVQTSYGSVFHGAQEPSVTGVELEIAEWVRLAGDHASVALLGNLVGKPKAELEEGVTALVGAGAIRAEGGALALLDTLPRDTRWTVARTQQARKRLVTELAAGTTGRFAHLLQLGDASGLVDEAIQVAGSAEHTGRVTQAFAIVGEAVTFASRSEAHEGWGALLQHYAVLALAAQSPRLLDVALYACSRAVGHAAEASGIWQLLDAARIVRYVERTNHRSLRAAQAVRPFEHLGLERWRRAIIVQAGYCLPPNEHARMVEHQMDWAAGKGVDVEASVRGWLGNARFRQGNFSEAAACHLTSFHKAHSPLLRMASGVNAAKALMECHRDEEALAMSRAAAELAADLRAPSMELRALWLGRAVAYRARGTTGIDRELVDVALRTHGPSERSLVLMTEAAAAWRADDLDNAGELALECARAFDASGQRAAALTLRGLAYRCGAIDRDEGTDALLDDVLREQPDWIRTQARALWSTHPLGPDIGPRLDILAEGEMQTQSTA